MEKERAAQAARVVRGNCARIKELMKRATAGDDIHIGFLGGSITQGSVATAPEKCYAARVYRWWEEKFPQSRFSYINAGIGGTTSLFGAARAWEDMMCYRPDFVVVDFTVNDDALPIFQETFEGVLRQLYGNGHTAVLILNNAFYDDGRNAQELHNELAAYYQIPAVSVRESIFAMLQDGTIPAAEITQDFLHPNDKGHELLAYMITYQLDEIYADLDNTEAEPAYPDALTQNRFEGAKRFQIKNSHPELQGFLVDPREKNYLLDLYKYGWTAEHTGACFTLDLDCSYIAVQYLRSIRKPRPVAEAVVDGDSAHAVTLDGNFDEDWGDCLALTEVMNQKERGHHQLTIRIKETHPSEAGPFYLVSVITD